MCTDPCSQDLDVWKYQRKECAMSFELVRADNLWRVCVCVSTAGNAAHYPGNILRRFFKINLKYRRKSWDKLACGKQDPSVGRSVLIQATSEVMCNIAKDTASSDLVQFVTKPNAGQVHLSNDRDRTCCSVGSSKERTFQYTCPQKLCCSLYSKYFYQNYIQSNQLGYNVKKGTEYFLSL
jgi:hypothetical protein